MSFLKRLGFFLFGLSIGLIFLAVFLRKKSDETGVEFCYFPNCRTLKDLRSKPIHYSDQLADKIKNNELDTLVLKQFFVDGEINFDKSDTKAQPCKKYLIESTVQGTMKIMTVKNCKSKIVVESLD